MDELGAALTALGDSTRRRVVEILAERPVSAGTLAARLDVSPALLTRHLRMLREAGMVRVSLDPGDHRRHVYELQPGPLRGLSEWAERLTTFWTGQLASFAAHAADTAAGRTQATEARSARR